MIMKTKVLKIFRLPSRQRKITGEARLFLQRVSLQQCK
ncbi:hypothetical protein BFO_3085 [Tannerella forsythia 92A2]|uniref:Uncharacterized protein n=1 Tax=Tannerella forsythia (strain ATCC 43037 / JCM 10827 / CCUG 21028 A / KCTC 5666 / FDC 338) TaxID=203275 RepID=G8UQC5_TANFA|nr:hypothetical protein BFO_3085 [Tannerella forsythia 92A2]BAR50137.1 hypothetical protein TF3313_2715 [Tannerella forsythia 3313]